MCIANWNVESANDFISGVSASSRPDHGRTSGPVSSRNASSYMCRSGAGVRLAGRTGCCLPDASVHFGSRCVAAANAF